MHIGVSDWSCTPVTAWQSNHDLSKFQTSHIKHLTPKTYSWFDPNGTNHCNAFIPSFHPSTKALNPTNMTKTGACTPKLRHKNCKWTPQHGQPKHPKGVSCEGNGIATSFLAGDWGYKAVPRSLAPKKKDHLRPKSTVYTSTNNHLG